MCKHFEINLSSVQPQKYFSTFTTYEASFARKVYRCLILIFTTQSLPFSWRCTELWLQKCFCCGILIFTLLLKTGLHLEKLCVSIVPNQQFLMCSSFHYFTLIQYNDLVAILYRRESMCNNDSCAAFS